MNGKKAIICSVILIVVIVVLIILKKNGVLHAMKVWWDGLFEPLEENLSCYLFAKSK